MSVDEYCLQETNKYTNGPSHIHVGRTAKWLFFFKQWQELCLSIKTNEVYIQAKVAKRGAKHHDRLPTHATRQSTHYHESSLPSIVAKQPAAPTSHGKTPTTHPKMSDQRARSRRLQQVIVAELNGSAKSSSDFLP